MVEARCLSPLFTTERVIPSSPKDLDVVEISTSLARDLNGLWHSRLPIYETGFCLNSKISFGAIYSNICYAVAIWSNPVARNLPQKQWLELRRMAIAPDAPKFTASFMLGRMTKIIRRRFPEVTTLVSYQDLDYHKGTIYRAANWEPDALHDGGSWNRPESKNLNGKPRTRPDNNNAVGPKQRWIYKLKEPK